MSFEITTKTDVFKFALHLYDYLYQHGHAKEAENLAALVDSCYPEDNQTIQAHIKALKAIKESVKDLPSHYQIALDNALDILRE